ncbi:hypothetical protein Tco_1408902 [Tanacetum coccineum]
MAKDDKQDDTSNNTSVRELGNVSLQCPKLTEANYTTWALMMETILKAYGIWETIVAKGVTTNEKKENTSKAIIFQTLPQDILMQVAQYSTAKEVWDSIKVKHLGADLVQKARLQTLRSELETLRIKPNEKVSDFGGKLSSIMAKFKGLGETLEDKVLVRKLLNSVPKKFLPIVATIEQYQDLDEMSFEEAVGRLTAYEERIKSQDTLEANDQDKLLMASSNNKRYGKWRDKDFNEEGKESMKWKNNPNARRASTSQGTKDKSKLRCYDCGLPFDSYAKAATPLLAVLVCHTIWPFDSASTRLPSVPNENVAFSRTGVWGSIVVTKLKRGCECLEKTIYILEMYRNSKFWWKKDPLVIPRGLAWSKIGNFKKGDYGALFAEWSNPILCMAPTSTELLQPLLIRSLDYFRILLVDGQPNGPITSSPEGIQPIICAAIVHDPQFEQQPKELIENLGDGDPSIVLKELDVVKQRINATEIFIKSRNDNLSEDSVAKQSVEKEIESSNGKADSAISNVLIGEISCQNLVQEHLQSRNMCIQSITNQIVQHPLESPKGNLSQVNEYAEFDFDNPENDSLSVMVKTGEEEIHLDGLETVDDPFVQTPDKQNSEVRDGRLVVLFKSETKQY